MKQETIERIRKITEDRGREPYHTASNLAKYSVEKARGSAVKYNKL